MKEYKEWIEYAEKDLEGAKHSISGGYLEIGAFLLQQSAEKALKAVLIKEQKKLVKTHNLLNLSKDINAPENIQNFCNELNPAYMFSRYPDTEGKLNLKEDINNLIKHAEEILEWVKKKL
ncbi:MAG: HEPN domain-containing protein [Nanoarchaeota archaeon]